MRAADWVAWHAELVGCHPPAAGLHPTCRRRGEPYWLRSDLQDVHTVEVWRRKGFEVLPEELDRPVKRLKKRSNVRGGAAAVAAASAAARLSASFDDPEVRRRGVWILAGRCWVCQACR